MAAHRGDEADLPRTPPRCGQRCRTPARTPPRRTRLARCGRRGYVGRQSNGCCRGAAASVAGRCPMGPAGPNRPLPRLLACRVHRSISPRPLGAASSRRSHAVSRPRRGSDELLDRHRRHASKRLGASHGRLSSVDEMPRMPPALRAWTSGTNREKRA